MTADGETYEGHWREGLQTGKGVWTNAAGAKYEGEWRLGERNGQVTRATRVQGGCAHAVRTVNILRAGHVDGGLWVPIFGTVGIRGYEWPWHTDASKWPRPEWRLSGRPDMAGRVGGRERRRARW
jgi:hypothetical protein